MKLFDLKNKKVLVVGLGLHGGGLETVKWLYREGAKITVTDLKTRQELFPSLKKLGNLRGVTYRLGGHKKYDFSNCDFVVKGPGVPVGSEYLKVACKNKIPIITDIHIFLANLAANVKVIGVTGTKGKSTTATLVARVLSQKYQTHLAGNIRKSVLEVLPKIKNGDLAVLELSSFQLEDIAALEYRFPVAILTSLFPDHINRHKTFTDYRKAKEVIFKYQTKDDLLVANGDDKNVRQSARSATGRVIYVRQNDFAKNAATVVGKHFGVPAVKNIKVIKSFKGLPGRLEKIRELNGVIFINDTTATNPGAAIYGIKAVFKKYPSKKLIVIAGGYDKKLSVDQFSKALIKYAFAVVFLPGEASTKIKNQISKAKNFIQIKDMTRAVKVAYKLVKPNGIVLLSPGAASFGLFKHEFDRGDKFVTAVKKLK